TVECARGCGGHGFFWCQKRNPPGEPRQEALNGRPIQLPVGDRVRIGKIRFQQCDVRLQVCLALRVNQLLHRRRRRRGRRRLWKRLLSSLPRGCRSWRLGGQIRTEKRDKKYRQQKSRHHINSVTLAATASRAMSRR